VKKTRFLKNKIEDMRRTIYTDKKGGKKSIGKLAHEEYKTLKAENPAEVIITTVLSNRQKWDETARPRVEKFKKSYTHVKTISELKKLSSTMNEQEFCKKILNLKITKVGFWRYKLMNDLISGFEKYQKKCGSNDDWFAMQDWAKKINIDDLDNDIIGKLEYVGLATVQHIRLMCGIDTSKSDVHVKNALKAVGLGNEIHIVDLIAEILGYPAAEIDQIFWYWDSASEPKQK
jgi:endonuclease III